MTSGRLYHTQRCRLDSRRPCAQVPQTG